MVLFLANFWLGSESLWVALFSALAGGGGMAGAMRAWASYQQKKNDTAKARNDEMYRHDEAIIGFYQVLLKDLQERIVKLEVIEEGCQARLKAAELEIQTLRESVGRMDSSRLTAIITIDDQGVVVDWNEAATALFLWSREEMLGKSIAKLMPARLWNNHQVAFAKVLANPDRPLVTNPLMTFALNRVGEEMPVSVLPTRWQSDNRMVYAAEIRRR